jgi:hypothetical protein
MTLLYDSPSRGAAPAYPVTAKTIAFPLRRTRDASSTSRARALADHDRQVLRKVMLTALLGLIAVLSATFTAILEGPLFWQTLGWAICTMFAAFMFAGVFAFCSDLSNPTRSSGGHR